MLRTAISLLFIFLLSSCGSPPRKVYPYRLQKDERFFGDRNGLGVFKKQDTLFFGKFRNGHRSGWHKVIFPSGVIGYRFFKNNANISTISKVNGVTIKDGKFYLSSDFSSYRGNFILPKQSANDDLKMGSFTLSYSKNKSDTFNTYTKTDFGINTYNGSNDEYTFASGHKVRINQIKENGIIYGYYRDLQGFFINTSFKETETTKNAAKIYTIYSKDFDIELSKIVAEDYQYQGRTKKGVPHGYGYWTDGVVKKWGYFKDGLLNGSVIEKDKNAIVYFGKYINGVKHGVFVKSGQGLQRTPGKPFLNKSAYEAISKIFQPLEDWYKNQKLPLPTKLEGIIDFSKVFKTGISYKYARQPIHGKNSKNYWSHNTSLGFGPSDLALREEMDLNFRYHHGLLQKNTTFDYKIYKDGIETKSAKFSQNSLYKCSLKILSGIMVYPVPCQNPDFYVNSSLKQIIHDPILSNDKKKLEKGYLAQYHFFDRNNARDGYIVNAELQGDGVVFSKALGNFIAGKLDGVGIKQTNQSDYNKREVSYGKFVQGSREGKFIVNKNHFTYKGRFEADKEDGKFDIINLAIDVYGTIKYVKGIIDGVKILFRKDKSIYEKLTYVMGVIQGEGTCVGPRDQSEICQYRNGKRVDEIFLDRMKKKKERAEKLAREEAARKERERKARIAREQRQREQRRRRAAENRRKEEARRQAMWNTYNQLNQMQNQLRQQNQAIQQQTNQIIQNSYQKQNYQAKKPRGNTGSYPVPNYKKSTNTSKSSQKSSKKTSKKSSGGSVLTLTATKPYKECKIQEKFKGRDFMAAYDCNRKDKTFPAARKIVDEAKRRYQNELAEIEKRKQEQERLIEEGKQKQRAACQAYMAKGGSICSDSCNLVRQERGVTNCGVIQK